MTEESEHESFRGVKCLHCGQPIPISPLIASMEAEFHDNEISVGKHLKCQTFNLRCVACGKEQPYKMSEILEFQGSPTTPVPHAGPTSAHWAGAGNRSRTANA